MRAVVLVVCLLALLAGTAGAAGGAQRDLRKPVVTLIGDSVAAAIADDPVAVSLLSEGVALRLDVATCRRLEAESCPHEGTRPPTVADVVARDGARLGDAVIVAVGYNDPEEVFASEVAGVVAALEASGIDRILWVTLRETRHPYVPMNEAIRAVAARTERMTVVDWNARARTFPGWFASDGIHLQGSGARSLAAAIRIGLADAGVAPALPRLSVTGRAAVTATAGRRLDARLTAAGGVPPYRWKRVAGTLPPGVHVTRGGVLSGVPGLRGRYPVTVRVTDSVGSVAERPLTLSVPG